MELSKSPVLGLATLAAVAWLLSRVRGGTRPPLPPGPPRKPLIGNLLDVPKGRDWLTYANWAEKYGDIISLTVLGQTVIVLNSLEDARELFVARATNYSERIRMTMIELSGWGDASAIVPPGERFRAMRRFIVQLLGPEAIKNCIPVLEAEIDAHLRRLIAKPKQDLHKLTSRLTGSIILRLVYGYEVTSDNDMFVQQSEEVLKSFHLISTPGWVVDVFPMLRHLPSWLPGMGFKRKASKWKELAESSRMNTFDWTKRQIASGKRLPCFAADLLEDQDRMKDERTFASVLSDLYAAGSDTTATAVLNFFLFMALHPEVQRHAQQEIDRVTRGERLPVYADLNDLPYVLAIVKEVHRWHPVGPMGFPHCAAADDEYKGFLIPKGAILITNVWNIFHNPAKYPNPSAFMPERHLERGAEDQLSAEKGGVNEDPMKIDFGFGLRQCPGRHLAQNTLLLTVAKVLATCSISDAVDENGTPLTPETVEFLPGMVARLAPFTVSIKPRSPRAQAIVEASALSDEP